MSETNVCNLVIQGLERVSLTFDIANIIIIIDTIVVSITPLIMFPNISNLIFDDLLEVSGKI